MVPRNQQTQAMHVKKNL